MLHSQFESYLGFCLTQVDEIYSETLQQFILFVLHSQYHACWCPGDFRIQIISKHGIDPQSQNILYPASEELTINHIIPSRFVTFFSPEAPFTNMVQL